MPLRPTRPARVAVWGAKVVVTGTLLALSVLAPTPTAPPADQTSARAFRMLDAHACSTTGFGAGEQPLSAVVRSPDGRLRFVDFDTGWRVYTERGAASLIAVCLDEPPA
ncbi:hypothetical protein [Nocardioides caricicola]|uniref:Uncharacterized protein n=1 Tax=Nocardioides caricicola TaxID=634770 RepID=A0ABW0N187_9ACTN